MKLYVVRHGVAADPVDASLDADLARPLTAAGRREVRAIGRALDAHGVRAGVILASPAVRTRQTAEILAECLRPSPSIEVEPNLRYDAPVSAAIESLRQRRIREGAILAVGHDPHLATLLSCLLVGDERVPIRLKKGGVAAVSIEWSGHHGRARFDILLTPRWMIDGRRTE